MRKNKLEHIALILDGNKRWAKQNNLGLRLAYKEGLRNISKIIKHGINLNIKYLTLFTLSSENLKRASVKNIFQVIYDDFSFFLDKIIEEKKIKINIIGTKENLPDNILKLIDHCEKETKLNNILYLNLAFNYGFKDEIKEVLEKVRNDNSIDLSNPKIIKELFLLKDLPDPDLLIRTGGQSRLSNFIMFNLTYTELFFIDTLWPDFNNQELDSIINKYYKIYRRYGL